MGELQPFKENRFDPNQVAIITTTFYPDFDQADAQESTGTVRGEAAIATLNEVIKLGLLPTVVDGGSSPAFTQILTDLGIECIQEKKHGGMSAGRLQGLDAAREINPAAKYSVWTEPEKTSLIPHIPHMIAVMDATDADIGIPARNPELFRSTYPDYQYRSEQRAANRINRWTKQFGIQPQDVDHDWFFGPRVYRNSPEVRALFNNPPEIEGASNGIRGHMNPSKYFNFLLLPPLRAMQQGMKVISIDGIDFTYPKLQLQNEIRDSEIFRQKRKLQNLGICGETIHYLMATTPLESRPYVGDSIFSVK